MGLIFARYIDNNIIINSAAGMRRFFRVGDRKNSDVEFLGNIIRKRISWRVKKTFSMQISLTARRCEGGDIDKIGRGIYRRDEKIKLLKIFVKK